MKSTIRILTMLILIFGIGVVAPKIIQTAMIAQGDSLEEDVSIINAVRNEDAGDIETEPELQNSIPMDNQNEIEKTDENIKENQENFPIKSAEGKTDVQNKNSTSVKETTPSVDGDSTPVDKKEDNDSTAAPENVASSNPTVQATETVKAVVEAPAVEKPAKIEITYKETSYARWVTTALNMRKGPGTEHGVLTSIPAGEKLTVTRLASNGWAEVSYNKKTGFVSGKYLSETMISKPAPVLEKKEETPQTETAAPTPAPAPAPVKATSPSYDAYKMYIAGKAITYRNGGQSGGQGIIDSNPNLISTWGGAATYSGTDGKNTHFIGHNPGIFSVMLNVSTGNTIVVSDGNAFPTTYKVTRIFKVDDYGTNPSDGENYYNYLASTRGGEVISLQTCLGTNLNLIIRAEKIN